MNCFKCFWKLDKIGNHENEIVYECSHCKIRIAVIPDKQEYYSLHFPYRYNKWMEMSKEEIEMSKSDIWSIS